MASFVLCTSYAAQSTDYRWDVNTAAEFRMALNASRASRLLCNTTLVGKETLQYVRRVSVVATSARTAEGSLAVNDDVAAEASILEQGRHAGQKRFRKVNVALHVGYVGTSYTGRLQWCQPATQMYTACCCCSVLLLSCSHIPASHVWCIS